MNSGIAAKAIKVLIQYGSTKLPIDTEKIALKMGYKFLSPSTSLCFQHELGFSSDLMSRECWSFEFQSYNYIVVSPTLSPDQRQNYIAHEIGHNVLRHTGDNMTQFESEADAFARHLRAPVPVLDKLMVESPKDIVALTGVDAASSQQAYRDLLEYREKQKEFKNAEKFGRKFKGAIFKRFAKKHKTLIMVSMTAAILIGSLAAAPALQHFYRPEAPDVSTADNPSVETVYWTDSGRVYHLYNDCQHIKKSLEVFEGSVEAAQAAGKHAVCKTCLGNSK